MRVNPEHAGQRLDLFLPTVLASEGHEFSRSKIQEWIKSKRVLLNGDHPKNRTVVEADDRIEVRIPEERRFVLRPEPIALKILFEDEHIVVVDKPSGLVVHPGAGNQSGTLTHALLHHCGEALSRKGEPDRPGIVHRLDRETSGCLVAAKSDLAYDSLVEQFSSRAADKRYVAVANGIPLQTSGRLENRIGRHPVHRQKMTVREHPHGKISITEYEVQHGSQSEGWSWIECRILTGRTHQIRVHLRECLRCPVLGDTIYAQPRRQNVSVERLMLHARSLAISHPASGETVVFESPFPEEFERFQSKPSA